MAYDYGPITATAARLLAKYGRAATIRRYSETASDPAAGTVTRSSTNVSAYCVKTQFRQSNTPPGALIEQGDLLAISDTEVAIGDEILFGSDIWQVIDVFPVEPGSDGVIWKAQIRGNISPASDLYYVVNSGVYVVNSGTQVVNTP